MHTPTIAAGSHRLSWRRFTGIAAALAIACIGVSSWAAAPIYRITNLGTLPGHQHSRAVAVNDMGQVTGESQAPYVAGVRTEQRAFIWSATDGMTDLGLPDGVSALSVTGFNDAGTVIGNRYDRLFNSIAFRWTPQDGYRDVSPVRNADSVLHDINDAGIAAGELSEVGRPMGAVSWSDPTGLVRLDPDRPRSAAAKAINDAGDMAVMEVIGPSRYQGALRHRDGTLLRLGHLPLDPGARPSTSPFDINASRQIVGISRVGDGDHQHAFLWSAKTGMQDLGTLPDDHSSIAYGVNRQGHVVGYSGRISRPYYNRMILWTPETGMLDVNDLIDPTDPLKGIARLDAAFSINSRGEIAGQAVIAGEVTAVLLTPVK